MFVTFQLTKFKGFLNPDYALDFVMKVENTIKYGAHGLFFDKGICYISISEKIVSDRFCSSFNLE